MLTDFYYYKTADASILRQLSLIMTKQLKIAKKSWNAMEEDHYTSRTVMQNWRVLWIMDIILIKIIILLE